MDIFKECISVIFFVVCRKLANPKRRLFYISLLCSLATHLLLVIVIADNFAEWKNEQNHCNLNFRKKTALVKHNGNT